MTTQRESPYDWCKRNYRGKKLKGIEGRKVRVLDEMNVDKVFTIVRIDDDARTVTWSLPGAWVAREWLGMDRECQYELIAKGAA